MVKRNLEQESAVESTKGNNKSLLYMTKHFDIKFPAILPK